MRSYTIMTETQAQTDRALSVLSLFMTEKNCAITDFQCKERLFGDGKRIEFVCKKSIWKKLKKELNLKIEAVWLTMLDEA